MPKTAQTTLCPDCGQVLIKGDRVLCQTCVKRLSPSEALLLPVKTRYLRQVRRVAG